MSGVLNMLLMVFLALCCLLLTYALTIPFVLVIPVYWFAVFYGADQRIEKVKKSLQDTLIQGENLISQGMQLRPFAFFSRRKLISITNSRVIIISRGLLGGFTMQDFQWKDLHDAKISENVLSNICGSNLTFKATNQFISVFGVENAAATAIYKSAQAEEQAWEEKRRIRSLEEMRAAAGGVTVNSGSTQSSGESSGKSSSTVTEDIEKAKRLLDSGAINDAEFQEIKAKILSNSF
jgi:hypothetical protein